MKINFKFLIIFFSLGNFLFAQINDNPAYYNPLKKVFDSRDVNLKYSKLTKQNLQTAITLLKPLKHSALCFNNKFIE